MNTHGRQWMYVRRQVGYNFPEWAKEVETFIDFAFSHSEIVKENKILCPCDKCFNCICAQGKMYLSIYIITDMWAIIMYRHTMGSIYG